MEKTLEQVNHIIEIHNEVLYAIRTMRNCIYEYLPNIIYKTLKTDLNFMKLESLNGIEEVKGKNNKLLGYKLFLDRYWTDDSIWCHNVVDIKKKHLPKLFSEPFPDIVIYPLHIWKEGNDDMLKSMLLIKEYERMHIYLESVYENLCDRNEKEILRPHIIEVETLIARETTSLKRRRRKLTNDLDL